ncbi:MAG: hypothetical protein WB677_14750, partial [Xanthobacteraceae bacterium]
MAKSRSKISRQPVKKSNRAAARRALPAKAITSRPAGPAATTGPKVAGKKSQWVYAFGGGKAAGRAGMRNLLGGKGAGLA